MDFARPALTADIVPPGPLRLTVEDAAVLALEHNRALRVQRLQPVVAGHRVDFERAAFDPRLTGLLTASRERTERFPDETDAPISDLREQAGGRLGVASAFPTGTELDFGLGYTATDSDRVAQPQHSIRAGLAVTQPLLRGRGREANRVRIEWAQLDLQASYFELRGLAEALLADVEKEYWDHVLAQRKLEIFESSLVLAERQLLATRDRIELGQLAALDIAAAEAETAWRRQALIDARGVLESHRLRLLRFMSPDLGDQGWDRPLELLEEPTIPEIRLAAAGEHVRRALALRPEIHEARLRMAREELEVAHTRHGLLPKLDLFITLGKSGFADSFGRAMRETDGDGYDAAAGLRAEIAPGRRQQQARYRQALASRAQAEESIRNLVQHVELDVRTARHAVGIAQEQIAASRATRRLQERVLSAETEKFETGLSTVLDVAQVQRDLLEARIAEVASVIALRQAVIDLFYMEGTLLLRRGVGVPGSFDDIDPASVIGPAAD